jgi:hypothetical protein
MAKKSKDSKAKKAKKAKKAAAKQATAADEQPKSAAKQTPAVTKPDQVEVLKLALRDTEAKLVEAEHRLRQVQQQLDDERRALAEAAEEEVAEAVLEAAVTETVAEAIVDAELVAADQGPAVVAEVVAETLDEVAALADPADPEADHTGEAKQAAAAFTRTPRAGSEFTPPLPEEPSPDTPSEEWTLVRLREEARRRGLAGAANLPKARLVERLTQG